MELSIEEKWQTHKSCTGMQKALYMLRKDENWEWA